MTAMVTLWVLVPAVVFVALAVYVISIGYRTRNADLRGEPAPAADGAVLRLVTVRGLDEPRPSPPVAAERR
ncbi:hypothetical protein ABZ806_11435 [Spirillospora sp. NPDC047418]|jgi:hypothetical protein